MTITERLIRYAQHTDECEIIRSRTFAGVTLGEGGRCTCGLHELLIAARAEESQVVKDARTLSGWPRYDKDRDNPLPAPKVPSE